MVLKVEKLCSGYGELKILDNVSIEVGKKEAVAIIGSNGAGKTTLLKTLAGLIIPWEGKIIYNGVEITRTPPYERVKLGISYVPCEKSIFPYMTVLENLEMGCYNRRAREKMDDLLERVFQLFPMLEERKNQLAGTLSGGEQRMLTLARGLMSMPSLLMLDEPSFGLAPKIVKQFYDTLSIIKGEGLSILLVEQKAQYALNFTERAYLLDNGKIILSGFSQELLDNEYVKKAYLGVI
ncbi:MAG TPA: ABC transporter ATP-binding protein [Thermofilum sp.]|nr:ABC transporter ATP-binding protein [Thermoproteales archaeon]RLE85477.1 MAG: ABC transporter ATP-binding protein [Thermoprotei archaeon]HDJ97462.1 ABC transporter ATP-binding protein [Thermofilum sp.]